MIQVVSSGGLTTEATTWDSAENVKLTLRKT